MTHLINIIEKTNLKSMDLKNQILKSLNAFAIVFELHNKRLNILSCRFPFFNAPFSIRVEVLLLLIK